MLRTVSAIFPDRLTAERAAADLRTAGFAFTQLDLIPQEHPGPTDIGIRLKPNRRPVTGALVGALVLGVIGWLIGWITTLSFPSLSHTSTAGPLWAAIAAGVVGLLVGAILVRRAPVEEGYYREQRIEGGATLLAVDAADREAEVRQILRRNGALLSDDNDSFDRAESYDDVTERVAR